MSVDIPQNMEEVAMKVAREAVHGHQLQENDVINQAVLDIMQSLMDEALEGHYDDVAMHDGQLIVTDFMGEQLAAVKPQGSDWVSDFKQNSDDMIERLQDEVIKIVGGR